MPRPDNEDALPTGLRLYLGLVLALVAAFVVTAPWKIGTRDVGRLSFALAPAAGLGAAALLFSPWRRALAKLFRKREVRFSNREVLLAAGAAALFLGRVVFALWTSLDVNAWDTGLSFDGPIFETLAGRPLFCVFTGQSYLAIHGGYLLFAFVPLYAVAASPFWLLAAQAVAVAGAAALSFLVFRRILEDDLAAALLATAFLFYNHTAKVAQHAFHIEVFYLPALFLLLYAYIARRPALFLAAVLLAVSVKEDVILPLGGFALAAAVFDRRFRPAALALGAGLAAFLIGTRVVIPHFSGEPAGRPWYSPAWAAYGETPVAAALGMLRHPARLVGDLARSGIPHLFEPLLLLPLAGFQWFLAALPALVAYGASRSPVISRFGLYYSATVLPFLFAAAAQGLRRVADLGTDGRGQDTRRWRPRLGALLVLGVCALDGAGYSFRRPDPARTEVGPAIASLSGRPVAVQGSLFLRAGRAPEVRVLRPDRDLAPDEALLLAPRTNPYPFSDQELAVLVRRLSADPRYRRTETPGGLLLFVPTRSETSPPAR
jgi:uncharacterized membrane protein